MEFGAELAKRLDDIDVDQVWGELAELNASRNPEAQKHAGPLHHAALSGYKAMCKLIITQCKCDVDAATIDGNNAQNTKGYSQKVQYLFGIFSNNKI